MNEIETSGAQGEKKKKKGLIGLLIDLAKSAAEKQTEAGKQDHLLASKSKKISLNPETPIQITAQPGKIEPTALLEHRVEQEVVVREANRKLEEAATRVYNKPFKDLTVEDKLAVLSGAVKTGQGDTTELRVVLSGMSKELRDHKQPTPEQWKTIRAKFKEIPAQFREYGADPEVKFIVERTKASLFNHVGDHLNEYGLTTNQLNDVARELEYTAWGAIPVHAAHPMPIDTVGTTYNDARLLARLTQFNREMAEIQALDNEDLAADLYKDLLKGVREGLNPPAGTPPYDNDEANVVITTSLDRIHFLQEKKQEDYIKQRTLDGQLSGVTTGAAFFEVVEREAGGGRVSSHEMDVIEAKYHAIGGPAPDDPEKVVFRNEIAKTVHGLVEGLERNEIEAWRVGGINPVEYQLDQYIRILEKVDHKAGESLRVEVLGRQWMHRMVHELRTSADPGRELVHESQQLEDVRFYKEILHQPGVSRALREIERKAEDLIGAETVQGKREKILANIAEDLKQPTNPERDSMRKAGISAEAAVRLADRFYFSTGRDGMAYNDYLKKHDLIQYVKDPDGHMVGIIKPEAPIFWNFFRLLYCPEAQMTFFHMGASTKPKAVKFWKNGEAVQSVGGRGVGALAISEMMRNHFGLDLQDFYSRRHGGYLVRAWGLHLYDNNAPVGPVVAEIGMTTNPDAPADAQEMHRIYYGETSQIPQVPDAQGVPIKLTKGQREFRELQSKYLHAVVGKNFAQKFGGVGDDTAIDGYGGLINPHPVTGEVNPRAFYVDDNHNRQHLDGVGTVRWEGVSDGVLNDDWKILVRKSITAVNEDRDLTPAQRTAMLNKIDQLNHLYAGQGGLIEQHKHFNDAVKNLTSHSDSGYMDLSNATLSDIPYDLLPRLEENIRGNFRDHVSGWTVFGRARTFVSNPSVANWMAFVVKETTAYTTPENFQAHVMLPATQALIKVHRGKLPFGLDIFGFKSTMSEYGKVYFQKALTDGNLHELMLKKVATGDLDLEQVRKLEGKWKFQRGEIARYLDFKIMLAILMGVTEQNLKEIGKESEKS